MKAKIIEIEEPDFGCEGRPDKCISKDLVTLQFENGRTKVVEIEEKHLWEQKLDEGMDTELVIEKGTAEDVAELGRLYDELCDHLSRDENYPGWKKGIYPTIDDAKAGVDEDNLFVARLAGKIVGTVILRHKPEEGYSKADWHMEFAEEDVYIVYTFAVHPDFLKVGVGKELMEFIFSYAKEQKAKAVRLDVYEKNTPAIQLYEKMGMEYIDTVDLGYGEYGLDYFKLFQLLL